jgi:hypothetical protein
MISTQSDDRDSPDLCKSKKQSLKAKWLKKKSTVCLLPVSVKLRGWVTSRQSAHHLDVPKIAKQSLFDNHFFSIRLSSTSTNNEARTFSRSRILIFFFSESC